MSPESASEAVALAAPTPQRVAPAAAAALRMRLLGDFELRRGDTAICLPMSSQRLLAMLALRGRCDRSRLAGTLWQDATEDRAMARLRTAIWRVNSVAPETVRGDRRFAALSGEIDVDVRRILDSSGIVLGVDPPAVLHQSLWDTSADALLPGWDDEWLVDDRERLRQLQLHTFEAQAEGLLHGGSFGLALEWALAALRIDPLRETAHRLVIRIHLAEGNLAEAQRAFARCADLFSRELGLPPTPATALLVRVPN